MQNFKAFCGRCEQIADPTIPLDVWKAAKAQVEAHTKQVDPMVSEMHTLLISMLSCGLCLGLPGHCSILSVGCIRCPIC